MPLYQKGHKGLPYYGSGAHRVAHQVGEIWREAPRETIDQGALISIAPSFSHLTRNATAGADGAVNVGGVDGYLSVVDTAGSDNAEIFDSFNGLLRLQTNDADNDELTLCFNGGLAATGGTLPFLAQANTVIRMGLRAKVTNETTANQCEFFFGVGTPVADPIAGITDGIYILKTDNLAQPSGALEDNTSATGTGLTEDDGTTAIAFEDDTWFEAGIVLHGITSVDYYWNGHRTNSTTMTNLEQTNRLAPILSLRNGEAAHTTMLIERMVWTQTTVETT